MKILVIAPSWVGDMMMSHSLYRTLKVRHPHATIDVMAPEWCRALLSRMPEVAQIWTMPIGHGQLALFERRRLGIQLRSERYQRAYILPNSFKSALIPFFARIPHRIGWRGEMRYGLLNDWRILKPAAFPMMVQRYVALADDVSDMKTQALSAAHLPQAFLWPQLQVTEKAVAEVKAVFSLKNDPPLIGFCPGAEFGPAKRWPHYHYAALAQTLIEKGYQIVLLGSAQDKHTGQKIRSALNPKAQEHCHDFTGHTSLEQAIDLIAACGAIVTNDSGLMHIAAALNQPLVALYGPSNPDFTPPLSPKARVIRLISGYHKIRKGDDSDGYHDSLIRITPEQVMAALQTLCDTSHPDEAQE
ncbi:ADP-heptose--LPS heptosyltransferase RfaF [Candidatus Williamhamiltonella defendens]|uniref:lipopolysaccharide heptosyltransferase II n=1 Tax=Candidatus Hamiltonella defensa (Bemisia tabaci) TaxID=672795 RepID=A0A249E137_9ENTR|nr:ADP-heptose--LPS heptosyltransferase RfaF [Candidatus Hamiltonella defensa]ASX27060.1 ADP-heptose--LPS heptosyltransferase [Candidatus Hamiltonella defensa (Bemisia tabaci)]